MKPKKKVAVVCNYQLQLQRIGGMDRFFVAFDKACKEKGWEVEWFFSSSEAHGFYKNLQVYSKRGYSAENYFLEILSKGREQYLVVITHFVALCTKFYKKISSASQAKIIAVDHNPRPLEGYSFKKRLKKRLQGFLYAKYIHVFVGVSQYTRNYILKDFGPQLQGKTKLIYNGIATSVYQKRSEKNFGRFIIASHLRKSKGIQDVISAITYLTEHEKKKIHIDVFGHGPYEVHLKKLIQSNGLENQFSFKGSSSNLPKLFKNYSYLLQPTYMECFSLSILESLAANVPVITTPVGGNPEIIKNAENGYLFPAKNCKALSQILQQILNDDLKIEKEVQLEIERDFNLQQMVKNHLSLLPCI